MFNVNTSYKTLDRVNIIASLFQKRQGCGRQKKFDQTPSPDIVMSDFDDGDYFDIFPVFCTANVPTEVFSKANMTSGLVY